MAANGDAVLVVRDRYDLNKTENRSEGGWTGFSRINESAEDVAEEAFDVAMDDAGNTIIVWEQPEAGMSRIYMREYSAQSGTWSAEPDTDLDDISPAKVTSDYTQGYYNPDVSMSGNGDAVIVFSGQDGTPTCGGVSYPNPCNQVYMTERRSGQWTHDFGSAGKISFLGGDGDLWTDITPKTAMDDEGNAFILWAQHDANNDRRLYMSEYK